jgi:cellobiose phosphorylase
LFHLLNPIQHADTPEKMRQYMVEPYGIAADIYSQAPFPSLEAGLYRTGSGGWTGYTGSAGWMYRLGIEAILGLSRVGNALSIKPCIPGNWPGFKVDYHFGSTHYKISVENPSGVDRGVRQILLDGIPLPTGLVPLIDDHHPHEVQVRLGGSPTMI